MSLDVYVEYEVVTINMDGHVSDYRSFDREATYAAFDRAQNLQDVEYLHGFLYVTPLIAHDTTKRLLKSF